MGESSDVPALRRGLAILRLLGSHVNPMTASAIAGTLELPRSTTYHLLAELTEAGFVTHLPEENRYGLGLATFELGSAYVRRDPLERLARPLLRGLVERTGYTAHLGILHGAEALYLAREQPATTQGLVTAVGVRLPAALPASGRAVLAGMPAAQVRALFPNADAFVDRTGRGPKNLPALRALLTEEARLGWSIEDGFVSEGYASVAARVHDHDGRPVAAISVTFRHVCAGDCANTWPELAAEVRAAAGELTARIGGRG
ncbi:IclR family transcriptional regulator [Sciscionella marina]|uniref:IclR family transcriptional regulator n=1 Tax=Sciscionella marina TaxID=508770 RepID=UPI0003791135|nr:IclR family transcriptional regulator [Sciscionella marina]